MQILFHSLLMLTCSATAGKPMLLHCFASQIPRTGTKMLVPCFEVCDYSMAYVLRQTGHKHVNNAMPTTAND